MDWTKWVIGKKFGMLTIIEDLWKDEKYWYRHFLAKCDCGKIKKITSQYLLKSKFLCCWCVSYYKGTHGMTSSKVNNRFYRIYGMIKQRCNNFKTSNYNLY